MADPVPVCDVLCEATEYLSKLGSNLRMRTDSLKHKRIRKDKLKNAHAVQKAVNRVLLICELSKKSIENVETGVKKILAQIGASQAEQDDEKTNIKSKSKDKYEYFTFDSRRLKIRKKINLKHYLSLKVVSNRISNEILDKYPVYENCKLYRARRRSKKSIESVNSDTSPDKCEENDNLLNKSLSDSVDNLQTDKSPSLEQNALDSSIIEIDSSFNESAINETKKKDKTCDVKDKNRKSIESKSDSKEQDEETISEYKNESTESTKVSQTQHKEKDLNDSDILSNEDVLKTETQVKEDELKNKRRRSVESEVESNKQETRELQNKDTQLVERSIAEDEFGQSRKEHFKNESKLNKNTETTKKSSPECKNKYKHIKPIDESSVSSEEEALTKKKVNDASSDNCNTGTLNITKEVGNKPLDDSKKGKSTSKKKYKHNEMMNESSDSNSERPQNIKKNDKINNDCKKDDSSSKKKYKHIKIIDESSDSNKEEIQSTHERDNKTVSEDTTLNTNMDKEQNQIFKTIARSTEINANSSSDNESENKIRASNCDEKEEVSATKKKNASDEKMENSQAFPEDTLTSEKVESKIDSVGDGESCARSETSVTKPLIKCVSITKLLKEDLIPKKNESLIEIIDSDSEDDSLKKNKNAHTTKQGRFNNKPRHHHKSKEKTRKKQDSSSSDSDDKLYWIQKRKEVKKFKAKPFDVKITRLPKFTINYLMKYNLKRIVQNELVLCEIGNISNENDDKTCDKSKTNKTLVDTRSHKKNKEPKSDISLAKNELLNDSDSDKSTKQVIADAVKQALLNDSDSDKQKDNDILQSPLRSLCGSDHDKKSGNEGIVEVDAESESNNTNIADPKNIRDSEESDSENQVNNKNVDNISSSNVAKETEKSAQPSEEDTDEPVSATASPKSNNNLCHIKESLLNNSDSDCENQNNKVDITDEKKLSSTNLNTSDNEVNKTNKNNDESKESDHNDSDSSIKSKSKRNTISEKSPSLKSDSDAEIDKNKEPKLSKDSENINETKSSLLKDSSDELKTSNGKRKRSKSESVSPSKRKHIRESMHAKKMLLTYSSSSDTDDEQLKSVLKEIRDSLLKGSDDEKKKSDKNVSESEEDTKKGKRKLKSKVHKKTSDNESSQSKSSKRSNSSAKEMSSSSSKKMGGPKNAQDSSCQNSDTQDDKDIDGLTNLKTLTKKKRKRRTSSSSSDNVRATRSRIKKENMPKVISEENFLKAETSSDAQSASDSEAGVEEEVPQVTVAGLNGDGIGHLAKDDLLEESDSSSSQPDKDTSDIKQEDSSDEDTVKARRRKANTISSDSEVGSSRKKDKGVRLSDFEDSECESSEPVKKVKRKKKGSDSDASNSSGDGSKKRRKRIKTLDDSDGSGSETENEGRNKHGRKNIRKVMGKNQLEEATKKAAREEKERIARIAERQKLYNNLEFDESGKPDEVVLDKVVLDFDPETKEPLIEVDQGLVKKLKPHQANGIKFMWNACFESVKRIKKDKGSGCILAHCMGLGKTLQVVSLTHTLLSYSELTNVNRVLVVCPLSTVLNWVNEFKMWLKHTNSDFEVDVYELSRYKQNSERAYQLNQWFQGGGVCVLGYEMFRNLSADNTKKFKKKMLRSFQESLVDPGPDLVVCDEGHLLKNEKTSLSQAMNRIKSLRRIVLTGTPLQNNLKEYYCMVQFVKPNLLGKYNEYLNRFVNPITNGQYTDSTEHDIRIMKRRSHVLHKMLDGAVQRRDYGVLAPFLPPKHEYVLFITLTEIQIKLYQHYLDNYSRRPLPGKSSGFLFPDFQSLQRIWTHPLVLKYNSERYEIMQQKKREREEEDSEGSLADFIDDDSTPDESTTEESSDDGSDVSDDSRKKSKKKKSTKKSKAKDGKGNARRGTRANPIEVEAEEEAPVVQEVEANPTEWWIRLVGDDELEDLRHSHKLVLLFDILRQCEAIGDKLLVFSQSLYSLDLIEHFLGKVDEATQEGRVDEKLNGHVGSWSPGIDYFRLDGSTSCENRSIWCKNFNREDNPRARLFLISTRAGGLGINLVAANRVVIFDVSWNPSHDVQSIFRVYRFGQKKPCYIYRFLAMGTMEEKIYERQVTKQAISKRVIDEQQIDRHYAENDLAELYKFEPRPPPREIPPLPKDRLFAEMLKDHEAQIYKYHEHDSLLENKEEETLTEEERKAAWEDFENEKTRPPPVPFAAQYMHNGMVPSLLAQQQQQLAYAALAAMLRKDMPNISDNQIRDMLPLIYNSNPGMYSGYDYGLLQKMNEIYKYAQPGLMNPGMMNPMMNPAGGMGMGGSSGLQYEPPWQRQQQQQQQMRLQQLLQQQQNQMGAKFYAGGLGSRDPVAMALQQQRAREMMLGERARPRGRPPAPPAHNTAAAQDVVNLDSD